MRRKRQMRYTAQQPVADKNNASSSKTEAESLEKEQSSPEPQVYEEKTPDQHDSTEIDCSQSPELSEGSPEPVMPPKIRRPMRMKLLPAASMYNQYPIFNVAGGSGSSRMKSPFGIRSAKKKQPSVAGVSARVKLATEPKKDSDSPPTPAPRGRTYMSKTRRSFSRSGGRMVLQRIIPRTRVLVTPERLSPDLSLRKSKRNPKNKSTKFPPRKALKKSTGLNFKRRPEKYLFLDISSSDDDDSYETGESSGSDDNAGDDHSGDSCDGDDESGGSDDGGSDSGSDDTDSSKELTKRRRKRFAKLFTTTPQS